MEEMSSRRKRINRLKKVILGMVAAAILIPSVVCIILGVRLAGLSARAKELEELLLAEKSRSAEASGVFTMAPVRESTRSLETGSLPESTKSQEEPEAEGGIKKVYLTFDDGPSDNTNEILDILKEYDVKATFFVVGKTDEQSRPAYRLPTATATARSMRPGKILSATCPHCRSICTRLRAYGPGFTGSRAAVPIR